MKLPNCARGDHEQCIATVMPERLRECKCRCHRQAINVEHRPTSREVRVRSRAKNWQGSKWYINAFPKPPETSQSDTEWTPMTKEEAWERFRGETRL